MPSNEQRRQAAKRKLERQLARRAERAKRRRLVAVITAAAVVVVAVVAVVLATTLHGSGGNTQAAAAAPPGSQGCDFTATPEAPASKPVALPPTGPAPRTGTVSVTLHTDRGDIPLTLDRAKAPCGVVSFLNLARAGFYDGSPCHRLTTSQALRVLQCGDPTGTGTGGPGYTTPDEPPTFLRPSQQDPSVAIYPRGTVAVANTGQPHTGGSQFFLVYGDSQLPPSYTVLGTVTDAGLMVLDAVAKAGDDGSNGQGDGKPKLPVTIQSAQVAASPTSTTPPAPPSQ